MAIFLTSSRYVRSWSDTSLDSSLDCCFGQEDKPLALPELWTAFGERVLVWVQPILEPYRDPGFAPTLAVGMGGFALLLLTWYVLHTFLPTFLGLSALRRDLRQIIEPHADEHACRWAFKSRFEEVKEAFQRRRWLCRPWEGFAETLVHPESPDEPTWNTIRPASYFNVNELSHQGRRLRWLGAWPNVFVGVGLLLTFVGLVAALSFATEAIQGSGDIAVMQAGLRDLLSAAGAKFWTSVAGVASSIVLSLFHRLMLHLVESQLGAVCGLLERGLLYKPLEELAAEQLRAQHEQTTQLKTFNTDLAVSIGKQVTAGFEAVLPQAFAPVSASLDNIQRELSEGQAKLHQAMTGGVGDVVTEIAGSEMKVLAGTLAAMHQSLQTLESTMSGASEGLRTTVQELRDALHGGSAEAGNEMRAAAEAVAATVGTLKAALEEATSQAGSVLTGSSQQAASHLDKALRGMTGMLNQASESAADAGRALQAAAQDMGKATEPVRGVADRLGEAAAGLTRSCDAAVRTLAECQQSGQRQAEEIRRTAEAAASAWQGYRDRFERIDGNLAQAFDAMTNALTSNAKLMGDRVNEIDSALSKSVQYLIDYNEELIEAVEILKDQIGSRHSARA